MKIEVTFKYYTSGVVPPRCRKPRTMYYTGSTTVEVAEVSGAAAPVAFRVPDYTWKDGVHVPSVTEWRWWDRRLWRLYLPWSRQEEPSTPGSKYFPAEQNNQYSLSEQPNEGAAIVEVVEHYRDFLIVNGVVWQATKSEPLYEVGTFGLGGNHGGTSLMIAESADRRGPENCFRADQYEEAVERAVRVATARGDDESVARIRSRDRVIEVLIPAAMTADPQRDAAVERAQEEIKVCLPRHVWQDLAARIAEDPLAQYARSEILRSV